MMMMIKSRCFLSNKPNERPDAREDAACTNACSVGSGCALTVNRRPFESQSLDSALSRCKSCFEVASKEHDGKPQAMVSCVFVDAGCVEKKRTHRSGVGGAIH